MPSVRHVEVDGSAVAEALRGWYQVRMQLREAIDNLGVASFGLRSVIGVSSDDVTDRVHKVLDWLGVEIKDASGHQYSLDDRLKLFLARVDSSPGTACAPVESWYTDCCAVCGELLEPGTITSYCSDTCWQTWIREHEGESVLYPCAPLQGTPLKIKVSDE